MNNNISVSHCPNCKKRMKTINSREHTMYGFSTIRRRRACVFCDFRISTVELPLDIGDSVFAEDK
tara:strand:+ start:745 stop:939 length:195 start_codon:yes stop_codon:yes gene_type:complete